jgi:hypothetical protein
MAIPSIPMAHALLTGVGTTSVRTVVGAAVVGVFGLKWLINHCALAKECLPEYYAPYVAGSDVVIPVDINLVFAFPDRVQ